MDTERRAAIEAGKRAGREECKAEGHDGSWDIGYLQGQADGHRLGRRRGRRDVAIAVSVAALVVGCAALWRRIP